MFFDKQGLWAPSNTRRSMPDEDSNSQTSWAPSIPQLPLNKSPSTYDKALRPQLNGNRGC